MRYKETKCEVEALNEELSNAYSRIKFLELEVIHANAKVVCVTSKKLDKVLAYQKPFSDRCGLGYIEESSSSANAPKEMKFVKAKEPVVTTPIVESIKVEKKLNVVTQKVLTKPPKGSLFLRQKGSLFPRHKEVPKHNIFAIIVESIDIQGQISTSFKH